MSTPSGSVSNSFNRRRTVLANSLAAACESGEPQIMWWASIAAASPRAEIDELVHDPNGTAVLGLGRHA